jgi:hypothetical protein
MPNFLKAGIALNPVLTLHDRNEKPELTPVYSE